MSYDLTIKTSSETIQKRIEDLKELRELLKLYETKTIEVDLHKVKKKVRSDVKWTKIMK